METYCLYILDYESLEQFSEPLIILSLSLLFTQVLCFVIFLSDNLLFH